MDLVERFDYNIPFRRFTVQEAMERQLSPSFYEDGELEVIKRRVDSLIAIQAQLIAQLFASNKLTEDEVLGFLPSFRKAPPNEG